MRFRTGIFVGYLLIAGLAAYFIFNVFGDEIKPSVRQAMEDSLVDTANLLAEVARDDLLDAKLGKGRFAEQVKAYRARTLDATIWGFKREKPEFRIYVTDAKGIVQFDSEGDALGKDFSQWNDIFLTLRGQYGVRSSRDQPSSPHTTMHVAAPIKANGQIIGVLSLAKSNSAVEPFIERTRKKVTEAGYWLVLASIFVGLLMSFWLSRGVQKLVHFAEGVSRGERLQVPSLSIRELKDLGSSLHHMRERLEGRRYVEDYVWALTHEMKSPLTAIRASAELLVEPMPDTQREKFLRSIHEQANRLHSLIEKMLTQASLEYRQTLDNPQALDLLDVLQRAVANIAARASQENIKILVEGHARIIGEKFLVEQAINNLLENALEFSPHGGTIRVSLKEEENTIVISIEDEGPGVPPYAQDKIFDRFYSLPRPGTGIKSTGLGLSFVREVMVLHLGRVELRSGLEKGTVASLKFPKNI